MKKHFRLIACLAALLLTTCVLNVMRQGGRMEIAADTFVLAMGEEEYIFTAEQLCAEQVKGQLMNGKGELTDIEAEGIELKALLLLAEIDPEAAEEVTIIAADEYSAIVTGEELNEAGKVYLIAQADGGYRLTVFGDTNSKRAVHNAVRAEVCLSEQ